MTAKLVDIGVRDLKQVAANLRSLANDLDSGKYQPAATAIVVLAFEDGDVAVYGYGHRASSLECAGWLARGIARITTPNTGERSSPPKDVA